MPPKRKKAATDKAAAKPAMSKKVKVKKEAPKSGVALEAGSWTLSGGLAKLPLELLHHVFYFLITATGRGSSPIEGAKSVLRFLSTTKALYTYSLTDETLFFKLYGFLTNHGAYDRLNLNQGYATPVHPIFSPKYTKDSKKAASLNYDLKAPLPHDAIFDWRAQFISTVIFAECKHCTHCGISRKENILIKLEHWNMRLCMLCAARHITRQSDVPKYNVTANDVGRLSTHVYKIYESKSKPEKEVEYYCGTQLLALAAQKHGELKAVKNQPKAKADVKVARSDMIATFALLQCGTSGCYMSWHSMKAAIPTDVDPGWFQTEFDRAISRAAYAKYAKIASPTLDGKGTPHPIKWRTVEEVINDWGLMIQPHMNRCTVKSKDPDQVEEPFFRPAPNPGPLVPASTSVTAYAQIREAFSDRHLHIPERPAADELILYQQYILEPTEARLEAILAAAEARKAATAAAKKTVPVVEAGSTNGEPLAVPSAKEMENETQEKIQELAEQALHHNWPAFQPSASQITTEEDAVKGLAALDGVTSDMARTARLERVNGAVRAAAISKITDASTKNGDLEKLKYSLIYDKHLAGAEPFGATYVDAGRYQRKKAKEKMLLAVYKNTSAARAKRVENAVLQQRPRNDNWLAKYPLVFKISGPYKGYLSCPAANLGNRTRYTFQQALASVTEIGDDCRANLITASSIDPTFEELAKIAYYKCPWRPERPFCAHNANYQCWFRHIQSNGTEWQDKDYMSDCGSMTSDTQQMIQMVKNGELDLGFDM